MPDIPHSEPYLPILIIGPRAAKVMGWQSGEEVDFPFHVDPLIVRRATVIVAEYIPTMLMG